MIKGRVQHTSRSGPRHNSTPELVNIVWVRALNRATAHGGENTKTFLWRLQRRREWRKAKILSIFLFTRLTLGTIRCLVTFIFPDYSALVALFNHGLQNRGQLVWFQSFEPRCLQELRVHFRRKSVLGKTGWMCPAAIQGQQQQVVQS